MLAVVGGEGGALMVLISLQVEKDKSVPVSGGLWVIRYFNNQGRQLTQNLISTTAMQETRKNSFNIYN